MEQDFTITKVSWHTKKVRNYEFDNSIIYECFKNIIIYLQANNLVTHTLLSDSEQIDDETSIKKSDLTEEGFELVKKVYGKWSDKVVDKKIQANDFRLLDKELSKIRSSLK